MFEQERKRLLDLNLTSPQKKKKKSFHFDEGSCWSLFTIWFLFTKDINFGELTSTVGIATIRIENHCWVSQTFKMIVATDEINFKQPLLYNRYDASIDFPNSMTLMNLTNAVTPDFCFRILH
jgi:hypothetical protein